MTESKRRVRPGARIVIATPENRFLLFHFEYADGPLAGEEYWGVPGGGIDDGETPVEGARRELFEETGIEAADLGPERAVRRYDFRLMSGEWVVQEDHYFLLRVPAEFSPSPANRTPEEKTCLTDARWWSRDELAAAAGPVMPPGLAAVVSDLLDDEKP